MATAGDAPGALPPETAWQRRKRLAEIFGDALPETTRDERDASGERERRDGDTWLREQVPPHHGS
ncbi:hypothetical protein [Nocardioides sp. Leaf374]|uniref:hypothetical protein n=1 Tax=Nocardioides sp. Leaf374 TaxID=2876560 RepID=UPI001E289F3B|nr:hypothetical protein [Nocardioides sp. Leaf374]